MQILYIGESANSRDESGELLRTGKIVLKKNI